MRRIINRIFTNGLRFVSAIVPKRSNLILFGAYLGNRFGDNSGALFQYIYANHREAFQSVWLTDKQNVVDHVRILGGEAYRRMSFRGIWLMLRASLIITSHGTQDVLLFKPIRGNPKEIYLHHGIPMRGVVMNNAKKGLSSTKVFQENAAHITYMTATSDWGARQQQKNIPVLSHRLKVTGYPRNDIFHQPISDEVRKGISQYRLNRYVILYAPTWRKSAPTRFFPFDDFHPERLAEFLRARNMTIVLRSHSVDTYRAQEETFWKSIEPFQDVIKSISINEYSDTQSLLQLADCLITDYSSIVYDYLLLNRSVIFIPYDRNEFENVMGGFLGEYNDVTPGPKVSTQKELIARFQELYMGVDPFLSIRIKMRDLAHQYQDGNSSARVYGLVREILRSDHT